MTPEQKLMQILAEVPDESQEKTASAVVELSINELEEVLRSEGLGRMNKTASQSEKFSMADQWGRELAHEKTASIGESVSKGVGHVLQSALHTPAAHRVAAGAAIGAAGGALAGGEGNRMGGALTGAAVGGAAGGLSRGLASRVGTAKGGVGDYARKALVDSGNIKSTETLNRLAKAQTRAARPEAVRKAALEASQAANPPKPKP